MPDRFDLLVVGDANPDVIAGPLPEAIAFGQREQLVGAGALTLGGSAAIMACGAARLGLRVAFAGRVGDDDAGRYVRDALRARGVDVSGLRSDPDLPTPLTIVLTRGDDRAIITAPGTLAATAGADVPESLLARSGHVHAASYFLMPGLAAALPGLFRAARAHGVTTSLDTNDDPAGRWDPAGLAAVLPHTDILLPNANEARHLARAVAAADAGKTADGPRAAGDGWRGGPAGTAARGRNGSAGAGDAGAAGGGRNGGPTDADEGGTGRGGTAGGGSSVNGPVVDEPMDLAAAALALATYGPLVVVKNGADGALCHDGRAVHVTAGIAVTPVDAVGAGDSFDAGFVAATLAGLPVATALELAAVCGALSTRAPGGTAAQPAWAEAFAHVNAPTTPTTTE